MSNLELNKNENLKNIESMENIISKLSIFKDKLISGHINKCDMEEFHDIIKEEEKLLLSIDASCEEVSYIRPYLRKCNSSYCITVPSRMANIIGLTPESRQVVYDIDEESKSIIARKIEVVEDLSGYKKYTASKSKVNKSGMAYNLNIPYKLIDAITDSSEIILKVSYSKNKVTITQK